MAHTKNIRKSDVLFAGPKAGERASTSSWWLRMAIAEAFWALGKDPWQSITAHSTGWHQHQQLLKGQLP